MDKAIQVTQPSLPPLDEYVDEISSIWQSHWLTNMGDKHKELEKQLREYLKVDHLSLFTNGHTALEATICALELQGEIITTPFSFASTTHAIVRNGIKPVFCDIRLSDCTMDPSKIEALITEKTSAILPVHVYGNPCSVEEIQNIADKHDLKIIYDAAHAFGAELNGRSLASFGDAAILSFHATKIFNTIEGGAVCFSDAAIGERLYHQKNFGIMGPESVVAVGGNAKMNEFSAAMGLCNLKYVDKEIDTCKRLTQVYLKGLAAIPGITTCLSNENPANFKSNYSYLPILVNSARYGCSREELYEHLLSRQIHVRKYFYPLISNYDCYRNGYGKNADVSVAQVVADGILTLPLHSGMTEEDAELVCNCILAYCSG